MADANTRSTLPDQRAAGLGMMSQLSMSLANKTGWKETNHRSVKGQAEEVHYIRTETVPWICIPAYQTIGCGNKDTCAYQDIPHSLSLLACALAALLSLLRLLLQA
eukprot:scaffold206699_cov22-Tisochrysis_lutea.AAC.2